MSNVTRMMPQSDRELLRLLDEADREIRGMASAWMLVINAYRTGDRDVLWDVMASLVDVALAAPDEVVARGNAIADRLGLIPRDGADS